MSERAVVRASVARCLDGERSRSRRAFRSRSGLQAVVFVLAIEVSRSAFGQQGPSEKIDIINALGAPRSTTISPLTGAVSESISLQVPPGRKEIQPPLVLQYTSLGQLGVAGAGWALETGRIVRSTKNGVPKFATDDEFTFSMGAMSLDLISVGNGDYRAKNEQRFQAFHFDGTRWTMTLSNGMLYRFGSTADSSTGSVVWMLDSVQDPHGNTITYSYQRVGDILYPTQIQYTGFAPTGDLGRNKVTLEYEDRPDPRVSYIFARAQTSSIRLHQVSMFAGPQLVRRYQVQYGTSSTSGMSLLQQVVLVGNDDSTQVTARNYSYRQRQPGWRTTPLGPSIPRSFFDSNGTELGVQVADIDGDGFVDLLDNSGNVLLGNGSGGFNPQAAWTQSFQAIGVSFVDGSGIDQGVRLVDVNGDNRPDVFIARPDGRHDIYLNNGTAWVRDAGYSASAASVVESVLVPRGDLDGGCSADGGDGGSCNTTVPFSVPLAFVQKDNDAGGVSLADVNGDGLVDIVWSFQTDKTLIDLVTDAGTVHKVPVNVRAVYLNTGSGFARSEAYSESLAQSALQPFFSDTNPNGYDVLDVNGDGLSDIVRTMSSEARVVFINTGTGWQEDDGWSAALAATDIDSLDANRNNLGLLPTDVNGDGLLDYIRADQSLQEVFVNTGLGWRKDDTLSANIAAIGLRVATSNGQLTGVVLGDIDGDGLPDILQSRDGTANQMILANGPTGDLLEHVTTGRGETTDLAYLPSTAFQSHAPAEFKGLPLTLTLGSALTRGDGRANSFTVGYVYAGGALVDGTFGGFATTTTTDPVGTKQIWSFILGGAASGSVASTQTQDSTGQLRHVSSFTYATVGVPNTGVTQIQTVQSDEQTFDPGASPTHTQIQMSYDAFLNTTKIKKLGDLDVVGDEGTTVIDYAQNLTVGIVDMPTRSQVFDAQGRLASDVITIYDGLPLGQVKKGDPTALSDSVLPGVGPFITRFMAYDAFGNVVKTTDANGRTSTYTLDAATNTFRTNVRDPKGRTAQSSLDPRYGTPLSNTDMNGQVTTYAYDAFGRIVRETDPGDELSPFGTKTYVYSALGDATGQFVRVSQTETPGQPGTFDVDSFFDGFGQVYRIESESDTAAKTVVAAEFDLYGNQSQVSLPFFAGQTPIPFRFFQRDALRRVTAATDPDGSITTTTYLGRLVRTVDRRGNSSDARMDAYGDVIQRSIVVGGKTRTTAASWDVLGRQVTSTDAAGQVTKIGYDGLGRRILLNDPTLGVTHYAYDSVGNLVSRRDGRGQVTSFDYDQVGQLIQRSYADGTVETFRYDDPRTNGLGRLTEAHDAAGKLELAYDRRGNVIERERSFDGDTYATGFAYDSIGRLRNVTYPDGALVQYTYGQSGRISGMTETPPDGAGAHTVLVQSVTRDAAGDVVNIVLGNNVTSSYTRDVLMRLTGIHTSPAGGARDLQNLSLALDPAGNVQTITDNAFGRSQSFSYDENNEILAATGPYGQESYAYDDVGNLLKKGSLAMSYDDVHKQELACGIDLGLATLKSNGVLNDPALAACIGQIIGQQQLPAADLATLQLIRSRSRHGQSAVGSSFSADNDAVGSRLRFNDLRYSYDGENRLRTVTDGHGAVETDTYDSTGNRVVRQSKGAERIFIDNLFETDTSYGGASLKHVWFDGHLLASISRPAGDVRLIAYAATPQLFSSAGGPGAGGCATFGALSDGSSPGDLLVVIAAAGLTAGFRRRRRWISRLRRGARACAALMSGSTRAARRVPGRFWTTLVLLPIIALGAGRVSGARPITPDESLFFYHEDQVGSVNVVTDGHGNEVQRNEYRPFGDRYVATGSAGGPHGQPLEATFDEHRTDGATGLIYFGARYYDALVGRFITADKTVQDSPNILALNRYVINANNPIRNTDRDGQGWQDWLLGIVLVVLIIVAIVIQVVPGLGQLAGGLLGSVAFAALVGLIIGAAAGIVLATILVASGVNLTSGDILRLIAVGALIGFFAGASFALLGSASAAAGAKLGLTTAEIWWVQFSTAAAIGGTVGLTTSATASAIKNKGFGDAFAEDALIGGGVGVVLGALSFVAASGIAAGSLTTLPVWHVILAGAFTPLLAGLYLVLGTEISTESKKILGALGL